MSVILLVLLCRAEEILLLSVGPERGSPHQLVSTDSRAMPARDPGHLVIVESNVEMLARKSQSKFLLYYDSSFQVLCNYWRKLVQFFNQPSKTAY